MESRLPSLCASVEGGVQQLHRNGICMQGPDLPSNYVYVCDNMGTLLAWPRKLVRSWSCAPFWSENLTVETSLLHQQGILAAIVHLPGQSRSCWASLRMSTKTL